MRVTPNQIKAEVKEIAEKSEIINSFFWGSFDRAIKEREAVYPLLCAYESTGAGAIDGRLTGIQLIIVVADWLYKDNENLDDIYSDSLQVLRDVFNIIEHSPRWRKLVTVRSASVTKFREKDADGAAGRIMTLNLDLKDTRSFCNLPMSDYDYNKTIIESTTEVTLNGSEFLSIPFGESQDIILIDQFGNPITPDDISGNIITVTT